MDSNKNLIIGLLVTVVVLGVGYSIIKKTPADPVVTPVVPIVTTPVVTNPTPTQPLKAGAPYATTNTMVNTTSSTAVVSGQANPNGSGTSYWFEYGETTSMGNRTSMQAIGSGFSNISAPGFITGLKTNTLYYFRLSTKNSFATVNGTQYTFRTNTTPPVQGMAPTTHTTAASDISRTTANVHGQINPNGFQSNYWFEYGKTRNLGNVTAFQSTNNDSNVADITVSISDLDPVTLYYFRLNSQNQYGTVNGATMSFTTKGPAALIAPTVATTVASNIKKTTATLSGKVNPNGAQTSYWFEYSENATLATIIGSGTSEQTLGAGSVLTTVHANAVELKPNTRYYYHIIARNDSGTTAGSIVTFKTQP